MRILVGQIILKRKLEIPGFPIVVTPFRDRIHVPELCGEGGNFRDERELVLDLLQPIENLYEK